MKVFHLGPEVCSKNNWGSGSGASQLFRAFGCRVWCLFPVEFSISLMGSSPN